MHLRDGMFLGILDPDGMFLDSIHDMPHGRPGASLGTAGVTALYKLTILSRKCIKRSLVA